MKSVTKLVQAPLRPRAIVALSTLVTCVALAIANPVAAQVEPADPLLDNPQAGDGNSSDPFSDNGSGQVNSMFDMIHQAQIGTIRNIYEFNQDQQEQISSEAEAFRARQRELLEQQTQPQAQPGATEAAPSVPAGD